MLKQEVDFHGIKTQKMECGCCVLELRLIGTNEVFKRVPIYCFHHEFSHRMLDPVHKMIDSLEKDQNALRKLIRDDAQSIVDKILDGQVSEFEIETTVRISMTKDGQADVHVDTFEFK